MNSEALIQAAIRAVVAAILAGLGVLIPWLASPEAQAALGEWGLYIPIIIGLLNGVAKAIGGATEPMAVNRGRGTAEARGADRPNPLAI